MNSICKSSYHFEWEDDSFIEKLAGKLPEIRYIDNDIINEIFNLKKLLDSYDSFWNDKEKEELISEIEDKITNIHKLKKTWHGIDLYKIRECIGMHKFCLILGNGGIGKSYFIKCFEEKLEKENINHLCVYGKFTKDMQEINFEEIISSASKKGFVFVVDAINEMSKEGQIELLEVLGKISKLPKLHIVITCRTNSMDKELLEKYRKLSKYEYTFPGVSFESALSELLKLAIPDIYMYEDILYSNNALFLTILKNVLTSKKIADEELNSTASITYILEQYVKLCFDDGKNKWNSIKEIAKWMYVNETKYIDYNSLCNVIENEQEFINSSNEKVLMDFNVKDGIEYYYFTIDSLTNFLIARSLFDEIKRKKDVSEKVKIIKTKLKSMFWLKEEFAIVLFDQMKCDYKDVYYILNETGIISSLSYETLTKVHFEREKINDFLQIFRFCNNTELMMHKMGGFTDKPFNCTNYLYNYYCSNSERIHELSKILSGSHFLNDIKNRLKNILYFVTMNNRSDRRDEEAFYFSLLCCAAPNSDVRCLATKLLYEVIVKDEKFIKDIINEYQNNICDLYIKESIIYILSKTKKNNKIILEFFNYVIENEKYLTAKSIRRIADYFNKPYDYINWEIKNYYRYNKNANISDAIDEILSRVDLYDKDFLPFKYMSKNHIDIYHSFLENAKDDIKSVNAYLLKNYRCVRDGECNGWPMFEKKVMPNIKKMANIKRIDTNSLIESLENVINEIFKLHSCKLEDNIQYDNYLYSTERKCIDCAVGIFYGSLMCNYYTEQFATFNNYQDNIGYEVYDPLEYGETDIITSPIPIYQELIETLGDELLRKIDIPSKKDEIWHKNIGLTKNNVLSLMTPLSYKRNEWVLLAGKVSMYEKENKDILWRDNYNLFCCTSKNETITNNGEARYLTIELNDYVGDLRQYNTNMYKPWLCKNVRNISTNSYVFEQTVLVLPPSSIINYFKLTLNISDLTWENQYKEKIILCNNNKSSYYLDQVCGTVFIRKDYFDAFAINNTVKYFAFAERFRKDIGYLKETQMHFEVSNDKILKMIANNGFDNSELKSVSKKCASCELYNESNTMLLEVDKIKTKSIDELLKLYGVD